MWLGIMPTISESANQHCATVWGMQVVSLTDDEVRVRVFKALADPARLGIVRILYLNRDEMNCTRIRVLLGGDDEIPNSTFSYHLKTLKEAGLTSTRKDGQSRYISLRTEFLDRYLPGFLQTLR